MDTQEMNIVMMDVNNITPYIRNPRKNKDAITQVASSIKEFGFRQPIVVDKDMTIVVGHTRYEAAKKLGYKEVPVHIAEGLSPQQIKAYRIADNKTNEYAEWDDELLKLELEDLLADNYDTSLTSFTNDELDDIMNGEEGRGKNDDKYTKKIEAPIYTPKGDQPTLDVLVDDTKTTELVNDITKADIPEEIKKFLVLGAQRHLVFDYQQIAEYYCHTTPEIQELMEKSALVIIDFDKAIENGFVVFGNKMKDMFLEAAGEDDE